METMDFDEIRCFYMKIGEDINISYAEAPRRGAPEAPRAVAGAPAGRRALPAGDVAAAAGRARSGRWQWLASAGMDRQAPLMAPYVHYT